MEQCVPIEPPRSRPVRNACGIVVLLLALVTTGDVSRKTPLIHGPVVGAVPDITTTYWYRFWFQDRGTLRMQLSEPARGRIAEAFADAEARARTAGFAFVMPKVRQTLPEAEMRMDERVRYVLAVTYQGVGIVMVNDWWARRLSDDELRALAAHEIGHVIDRQNQRQGHPFLDSLPPDDAGEFVADMIAGHIYSIEAIQGLDRRIATEP